MLGSQQSRFRLQRPDWLSPFPDVIELMDRRAEILIENWVAPVLIKPNQYSGTLAETNKIGTFCNPYNSKQDIKTVPSSN